ncbi:hypothetical protein SAMN04489806_0730 [Paramicrobacterium humi]|uniref:Uncharacterized protein n=1 Tax=Paramicrobacterium humi TaxID=640635 RepID=A0A1H4JKT4_9MICO|nr:hypothetical protein [Microbacterium humi]SEB46258.1 hypothetical protein SAMN04489806_0730 [Microbacterium humi]
MRRAVLRAARDERNAQDRDLEAVLAEMTSESERLTRSLLGSGEHVPAEGGMFEPGLAPRF